MLPRERVFAALDHQEPDRIPWGEHSIDFNVYEDVLGRETFVQAKMRQTQAYWDGRRDEVVESHKRDKIDLVRALDMDILAVNRVPGKGHHPAAMTKLSDDTYQDGGGRVYQVSSATHDLMPIRRGYNPNYKPPTVDALQRQIDRVDEEPLSDPEDSCWEYVRHGVAEMKDTHFIMLMFGDVSFPGFGGTEEDFWINLLLEPEICRKIAELQGRRLVRQVRTAAQLGVDGIMPCGDLGSSTGMLASPGIYRDMVYPWHKAYTDEAHRVGLRVLKHCCGHIWPVIEEIAEVYDAYEGIQASGGMDIKRLKCEVGDKTCLWGGIWHEHIIGGTPQDIRDDARYAFANAAPGGGYIMGSSHSLAVGAKLENILEMKRCRDKWGVYPIRPSAWS